ncbi:MAG: hypothetical protein ACRELD_05110 [Longimicrobiales bacterium]
MRARLNVSLALAPLMLLIAPPLAAQLRPIEPADWAALEASAPATIAIGALGAAGQRAALAGSRGTLLEIGIVHAALRTGRVLLEIEAGAVRVLDEDTVLEPPAAYTRASDGRRRVDAGDIVVSTLIALTPLDRAATAALRFGTRLPTSDNTAGLERDQTDFFVTFGGRARRDRLRLAAELGLAILGTRDPLYEQADMVTYAGGARLQTSLASPFVALVGQWNPSDSVRPRGIHNLAELRAGLVVGHRRFLEVTAARGLTALSPGVALRISAGVRVGG